MRLKIFSVVFIVLIMVLLGSSFLVYTQMLSVQDINLDMLEDKLYSQDTEILSWAMRTIDVDSLQKSRIPASWAEIMAVDNDSFKIMASTNKDHTGLEMYKIPELLDQASPVIDAINGKKAVNVDARDYMVAVVPLDDNRSLVGFKPKSWEKTILHEQKAYIDKKTASIKTTLLIYCAAGLFIALVAALLISHIAAKPIQRVVSAFEQLSTGNFDTTISDSGGRAFASLAESFSRLKSSLMMALERLGGK